ncbi:MAG TPA: NAD(P)/FAD-dependent oxidoreductase [Microthrixaceae bacterium]|nr:NAD(P)/FAD-dependent oxidoreductase [Microthrixaceae bacterium]
MSTSYDAVIVGAGPNGLTAAALIARAGHSVLVVEAADTPGGGARSAELTLPGFVHDVCSAIHPIGYASPVFTELGMRDLVDWVHPIVPAAHPLPDGRAAFLHRSLDDTVAALGEDGPAYRRLMGPFVDSGDALAASLLAPLDVPPRHPITLARYGLEGLRSARSVAKRFDGQEGRALIAGMAAHSMLRLDQAITGGFGIFLASLGHHVGWPMTRGGSQAIADALVDLVTDAGGKVVCGQRVASLDELPTARATLLDLTPRQVIEIAGDRLPSRYRRQLERYRYGPGVFKIDYALEAPLPWANAEVAGAGTVHVGGTFEEVAASEAAIASGRHAERPYVLLAQQSPFDPSRAPQGKHTAWAYCHVPHGSAEDQTDAIEAQIERFAPGFRDVVLARHTMSAGAVQVYDANYVGGDINGGAADLRQFLARPVPSLRPWKTPVDGLYLCSSSTPPSGGVHGMCGYQAARLALKHSLR